MFASMTVDKGGIEFGNPKPVLAGRLRIISAQDMIKARAILPRR